MVKKHDSIKEMDKLIGTKIYSLRLAKGMAREQLASSIGVTHQQLLKYEKGINRISVGRLVLIAKALKEEIMYFYQGSENHKEEITSTQHQRMCIEVSRNFMKISCAQYRRAVNDLIKTLSNQAA